MKQASSVSEDIFCLYQAPLQSHGIRRHSQMAHRAQGSRVACDGDRIYEQNSVPLAICLIVITPAEPTPMRGRLLSSGRRLTSCKVTRRRRASTALRLATCKASGRTRPIADRLLPARLGGSSAALFIICVARAAADVLVTHTLMFLSRVHTRPGANPFDQFLNSGFLSLTLRPVAIHTECFAACQFVRLACLVEQDLGRVAVARNFKTALFSSHSRL